VLRRHKQQSSLLGVGLDALRLGQISAIITWPLDK
jgi:hypothetical protein